MKKITCSLILAQDNFALNLKELIKVFVDKVYYTPAFDEYSIVSSEPISHEDIFYSALCEFDEVKTKKDEHDFDYENATFEIIEKKGGSGPDGYGKFMLKIFDVEEQEYEVTVPKRSKLFDE